MAARKNKLLIRNNTDESHPYNVQPKKTDTGVYAVGFHLHEVQEQQS